MKKRNDPNVYPPGLTRKKIEEIIAYCDAREEADLATDAGHELISEPTAWIEVPIALVPQVRKLIARHRKSA